MEEKMYIDGVDNKEINEILTSNEQPADISDEEIEDIMENVLKDEDEGDTFEQKRLKEEKELIARRNPRS